MARHAHRIDWKTICEETLARANHVFIILALRTGGRPETKLQDFARRLDASSELRSLRRRKWIRGDQLRALLQTLVLSYRTSRILRAPDPSHEVSLYSTLRTAELKRRIRVLIQAQEILREPGDPIPHLPGTTLQVAAAQASALVWFYQHALDHRASLRKHEPSDPPESAVGQLAQKVVELFPDRPRLENLIRIRRLAADFWDYGKGASDPEVDERIRRVLEAQRSTAMQETIADVEDPRTRRRSSRAAQG